MVVVVMCALFYMVLFMLELVPIYKSKDKKLFWIYTIIFISTFVVHQLISFGIKVPSPAVPIKNLIAFVFNLDI